MDPQRTAAVAPFNKPEAQEAAVNNNERMENENSANVNGHDNGDIMKLSNAERAAIALKEAEQQMCREVYEERERERLEMERMDKENSSKVNTNDKHNDKHNDNDKDHRKLSDAERAAIALKEAELEPYREAYEERRQELLERQRQQHQSQKQKHDKSKSPRIADDEGLAKIANAAVAAAGSAPVLCDADEIIKKFQGDDDDDTESEDDGDFGADPVEPLDDIVMIVSPMSGRRKRLFASKSVLNPNTKPSRKRTAFKSVSYGRKQNRLTQKEFMEQRERQAAALLYTELPKEGTKPAKKKEKTLTSSATKKSGGDDNSPRVAPVEVYRGPPDDKLGGVAGLTAWPKGWIKVMVERQGGTTKGTKDRYWYSPGGRKFRSMTEIKKFFKALALPEVAGNETAAFRVFKSIQL